MRCIVICTIPHESFNSSFVGQFAEYTEQAKEVILARDWDRLGDLMDANFALRRKTYVQSICCCAFAV